MKVFLYGIAYLIFIIFLVAIGSTLYFVYTYVHTLLFALIAIYLFNLIFSMSLFVQTRHSQAKISWLMVMFILPIIGCIIFLIFGQRYKNRKSIKEYQSNTFFKYENYNFKTSDLILNKTSLLSKRGIYQTNIELYETGHEAYEKLFEDIAKAKKFIFLQYYIIKPGEIYEHLKFLLLKKASEGVEIKLIIDDFGRWAMPWYEIKDLKQRGIEVEIFGRVHFPFISASSGYRTHRKMTIIDGEFVHSGGINISNQYASIDKKFGLWMDYQAKLYGEITKSFLILFVQDWNAISKNKIEINDYLIDFREVKSITFNSQVTLVEGTPELKTSMIQDQIIMLILNAKKSIKITTPYLVPTPEIESALRIAALNGVDVSLYIPGLPDKKSVFIATQLYAKKLSEFGVKIFEQNDTLIHSKLGVFDDEYAYFGTINIDVRSMYAQFEILLVNNGKIVQDIKNLILKYEKTSSLINYDKVKPSWFKEKLTKLYVNLFSSIM